MQNYHKITTKKKHKMATEMQNSHRGAQNSNKEMQSNHKETQNNPKTMQNGHVETQNYFKDMQNDISHTITKKRPNI